jgi:hypothetical protein
VRDQCFFSYHFPFHDEDLCLVTCTFPFHEVYYAPQTIFLTRKNETVANQQDDWSEGTGTPPSKIDANYQAIIDKQTNHTYSTYGPIVLAHELTNFTMNEMIKYLPAIKSAFAHVVPVAVAYNQTTPYVEQDVVFPTFEQFVGGDEGVVTTSVASTGSASASGTGSASGTSSTTATASSGSSSGNGNSNNGGGGGGNKNNAGPSASAKPSSAAVLSVSGVQLGGWAGAVLGMLAAIVAL